MATPPTSTTECIGTNVKRLREERGMLVRELADKAGITRWTVTNIEAGHVRALGSTLGRIALALDVPLSKLTDEEAAA